VCDIRDAFGGILRHFFPRKDGKILGFYSIPQKNPDGRVSLYSDLLRRCYLAGLTDLI
jgi:hypothetical protein